MASALMQVQKAGITTVYVQLIDVFVAFFTEAFNLKMLDGSYWFLITSGFNLRHLTFDLTSNATDSFTGIWQIDYSTPYDVNPKGNTPLAKEWNEWYRELYGFDAPVPGKSKNYNISSTSVNAPITKYVPNGCKNSSEVNITRNFPTIQYNLVSSLSES
jgi:hypothetical protein